MLTVSGEFNADLRNFTSRNNTTSGNRGGFYLTTNVGGNHIWNSGVPYIVEYTFVKPNTKLTIGSGSIIKLTPSSLFIVNGELKVLGNKNKPGRLEPILCQSNSPYSTRPVSCSRSRQDKVYFTFYYDDSVGGNTNGDSNSIVPRPGDWAGIGICQGASATLSNAVIRYGGYPSSLCGNLNSGTLRVAGNAKHF